MHCLLCFTLYLHNSSLQYLGPRHRVCLQVIWTWATDLHYDLSLHCPSVCHWYSKRFNNRCVLLVIINYNSWSGKDFGTPYSYLIIEDIIYKQCSCAPRIGNGLRLMFKFMRANRKIHQLFYTTYKQHPNKVIFRIIWGIYNIKDYETVIYVSCDEIQYFALLLTR